MRIKAIGDSRRQQDDSSSRRTLPITVAGKCTMRRDVDPQRFQRRVVSNNWLDTVAPPSWRHLPAGCRRYGQRDCPAILRILHWEPVGNRILSTENR